MATKKTNWDGRSRPSGDKYRKNYDEIFGKNLEGTVINIGETFTSKDFLDQAEREKKELEESYQEADMSYENESKRK